MCFKQILCFCRIDHKNTHEERRATDRLAAILDLWTMFFFQITKILYGIKVSYPLNAEVYIGRQPNVVRDHDQRVRVVKAMVSPWYKLGRNVVGNNLFIAGAQREELVTHGLTYVGTMRKNK